MAKIDLLKRINQVLNPDGTEIDFKSFDKQVDKLKKVLKEKIQVQTLEDVNAQLDKFRKRIDLDPLMEAIDKIEDQVEERMENLSSLMEGKSSEIQMLVSGNKKESQAQVGELLNEVNVLRGELLNLNKQKEGELKSIKEQLEALSEVGTKMDKNLKNISQEVTVNKESGTKESAVTNKRFEEAKNYLEDVVSELRTRINSMATNRGGNANRQILINGVDALTRYTDINIKPGSNVTITYANNNTTKKVDITLSATGGSGSVTGTSRNVVSTAVTSTVSGASGTDVVTICTAGVKINLPTASGNNNLYTIKNTAASSVLVSPDGADTIDGDSNIILRTQYTAVDLISDGSSNWNIT